MAKRKKQISFLSLPDAERIRLMQWGRERDALAYDRYRRMKEEYELKVQEYERRKREEAVRRQAELEEEEKEQAKAKAQVEASKSLSTPVHSNYAKNSSQTTIRGPFVTRPTSHFEKFLDLRNKALDNAYNKMTTPVNWGKYRTVKPLDTADVKRKPGDDLYTGQPERDEKVDEYLSYTGTQPQDSQLPINTPMRPDNYFVPFADRNYYNDAFGSIRIGMNQQQAKNFEGKFALANSIDDKLNGYEDALKRQKALGMIRRYWDLKREIANAKSPNSRLSNDAILRKQTEMFDVSAQLQQMYPRYFMNGDQKAYDNLYVDIANNLKKDMQTIDEVRALNTSSSVGDWLVNRKRDLGLFLAKHPTLRRMASGAAMGASTGAVAGVAGMGVGAAPGAVIGAIAGAATGLISDQTGLIDKVSNEKDSDAWWTDDVFDGLSDLEGYMEMSEQQRKAARDRYSKKLQERKKFWEEAILQNTIEQKEDEKFWNVTDYFKHKAETADKDLNIDNILYTNVQQLGYSAASWDKQAASMVLSMAMNPVPAALGAMLSYEASREENRSQILEDLCKRVKSNLQNTPGYGGKSMYEVVMEEASKNPKFKGMNEDDILNSIAEGRWMPNMPGASLEIRNAAMSKIVDATVKARQGMIGTYEQDMIATGTDALVQFGLFAGKMPKGFGSKIGQWATNAQRSKFVQKGGQWAVTKANALTNKAKNVPFLRDWYNGSSLGLDAVSVPLGAVGKAVGATAKAAGRLIDRNGEIRYGVPGWLWGKALDQTSEFFRVLPGKIVGAASSKLGKNAGIELGMKANSAVPKAASWLGKQFLKENTSEAIEEGKQYLNGKAWAENADPSDAISFYDQLLKDKRVGSSLITSAAGIPLFSKFGLAAKDDELYANMVGGWLGGAMHNVAINGLRHVPSMVKGAADFMSEGRTYLYGPVLSNIMADHTNAVNSYFLGTKLAKSLGNKEEFDRQWQMFVDANKARMDAGVSSYTQEEIDAEKKYADEMYKSYTDRRILNAAQNAGIRVGSNEYAKLVSAYTAYKDELKGINEAIADQDKDIDSIVSQMVLNNQDATSDDIENSIFGDSGNAILQAFAKKPSAKKGNASGSRAKSWEQIEEEEFIQGDPELHKINLERSPRYRELYEARKQEIADRDADVALANSVANPFSIPTSTAKETDLSTAIKTLAEIKAIRQKLSAMSVATDNSDSKIGADTKWAKNRLLKRLSYLISTGDNVMIDDILRNVLNYIDDTDKFEELVSLYQDKIGVQADGAALRGVMQALTGQEVATDVKKALSGKKIEPTTKGIINALDNSMRHHHDLMFNVQQEIETRDLRAKDEDRALRVLAAAVSEEQRLLDESTALGETSAERVTEPELQPEPVEETVPPVEPEVTAPESIDQEQETAPETAVQPEDGGQTSPVEEALKPQFRPNNRIFTEDVLNDALKLMHLVATGENSDVNSALRLKIAINIFGYFMEDGPRSFVDVVTNVVKKMKELGFAEDTVKDLGRNFRSLYLAASAIPEFEDIAGEFDERSVIMQVDVNGIIESVYDEDLIKQERELIWKDFVQSLLNEDGVKSVISYTPDGKIEVAAGSATKDLSKGDKVVLVNSETRSSYYAAVYDVPSDPSLITIVTLDDVIIVEAGKVLSYKDTYLHSLHGANSEQLEIYKQLDDKTEQDNLEVEGRPSPHDYFIKDGDNLVLYPRVHTYLGDQYPKTKYENDLYQKNILKITELINQGNYEALRSFMKNPAKGVAELSDESLNSYIRVLQQNDGQKQMVIEALTSISSSLTPGISVDLGNVFDEIVRVFFDTDARIRKPLNYDTFTIDWNGKQRPVKEVMDNATFTKFLRDLEKFKLEHEGWIFHTKKHTWHTEIVLANGSKVRVAGETDVIGINPQGEAQILDTKTSSSGWVAARTSNGMLNKFTEQHRVITKQSYVEHDGQVVSLLEPSTSIHSTEKLYSNQLSMYYLIIRNAMAKLIFTNRCLALIPVTLKYNYDAVAHGYLIDDAYIGRNGQPSSIDLDLQQDVVNGALFGEEQTDEEYSVEDQQKRIKEKIDELRSLRDKIKQDIDNTLKSISETYEAGAAALFDNVQLLLQSVSNDVDDLVSKYNDLPNSQSILDSIEAACSLTQHDLGVIEEQLNEVSSSDFSPFEKVEELNARQKSHLSIDNLCDKVVELYDSWKQQDLSGRYINQTPELYAQIAEVVRMLKVEVGEFLALYQNPTELSRAWNTIRWFDSITDPAQLQTIPRQLATTGYIKQFNYKDFNTADRSNDKGLGVEQSVAIGSSDIKLTDFTGNDDFELKATFTVVSTYSGRGKYSSRKYIRVTPEYDGIVFSDIEIQIAENADGLKMYSDVIDLMRKKKSGEISKDANIVLTGMLRTAGKPEYLSEWVPITLSSITSDMSIYDISLGSEQFTFGIAEVDKLSGSKLIMTYGTSTDGRETKSPLDYVFSRNEGTNGVLYAIIRSKFTGAHEGSPRPKAEALHSAYLNDLDVNLLLDLFQTNKTPSYDVVTEDGEIYSIGLSHEDIISLYFSIGRYNKDRARDVHVSMNGQFVTFTFEPTVKNPTGTMAFNLLQDDSVIDETGATIMGRNALKEWLKTQTMNLDKDLCLSRLGNSRPSSPFGKMAKFFADHNNQGVNEITIAGTRLKFERSDFSNPAVKGDKLGMTGLAWLMKNGFIETRFKGIGNPRISFTGVQVQLEVLPVENVVEDTAEKTVAEDYEIYDEYSEEMSVDDLFDSIDTGILEHKQSKKVSRVINEDAVTERLHKMFGKKVPVEVVECLKDHIKKCSPSAVGAVYKGTIWLLNNAEDFTDYHEAFHYVFKYLMPKRLHNIILRGAKHKLKELYGEDFAENASERRLEEAGAELCRLYFQKKSNIPSDQRRPFDFIRDLITLYKEVGSVRLQILYMIMNSGLLRFAKFRTDPAMDTEPSMRIQVRNANFLNIFDERMYHTLIGSIAAYAMKVQGIKPDGSNLIPRRGEDGVLTGGLSLTKESIDTKYKIHLNKKTKDGKPVVIVRSLREIMHEACNLTDPETGRAVRDEDGKLVKNTTLIAAIDEMFDNWDSVKPDVESFFGELGVDYYDEEDEPTDENGSPDTFDSSLSDQTKASYERSRHIKVSPGLRLMLSFIRAYTIDENGRRLPRSNYLGLIEFMDRTEVLSRMLSDLHEVSSQEDMMNQIRELADSGDMMYKQILNIFEPVEKGIKRKDGSINYRCELVMTLLYNFVSCAQMEFKRISAHRNKEGFYSFSIKECGQESEMMEIRRAWGRSFVYRMDENGFFMKNPQGVIAPANADSINALGEVVESIVMIKNQFSNQNVANIVDKKEKEFDLAEKENRDAKKIQTGLNIGKWQNLDVTDDNDLRIVKRELCKLLSRVGMQITLPELQFMLDHKYKDVSLLEQMKMFMQETREGSIVNLTSTFPITRGASGWVWNVHSNVNDLGKLNKIYGTDTPIEDVYVLNSFAIELSTWKYKYAHSSTDMNVLVSGNKYYVMTDNSHITDVTREISQDGDFIDLLSKFCYNIITDGNERKGSIIVKEALKARDEGKKLNLHVCTPVQFKTNSRQDDGSGYFDINDPEDYVLKTVILESGGLITPTMSDKKTWHYIVGIDLPGITYSRTKKGEILSAKIDDTPAIDQLLEYAETELAAIEQTILQLNDGTIPELEKVDNYHSGASVIETVEENGEKKEIVHKIANGTIFSQLCGIYREDGTYVSFTHVLDKNGKYVSPEQNVKIAKEEFFSKSLEERRKMMRRVVAAQTEKELLHMYALGLVAKNPTTGEYSNLGLNNSAIMKIAQALKDKEGNPNADINDYTDRATRLYTEDYVRKSIMSISEIERVYSGHPGFFEYEFKEIKIGDVAVTTLVDRSTNLFKRFGGLVSTGTNNNTGIEGLPSDKCYNLAEINDQKVISDQKDELSKWIKTAEWYSAYSQLRILQLTEGDKMSKVEAEAIAEEEMAKAEFTVETAEAYVKNNNSTIHEIIEKKIKDEVSVYYDGKINVADGSAFMSPQMTEWMLRMCGSYDNKVAKAFEILRDRNSDVRSVAEAYKLVLTKVIGAQKYTAYGMRLSRDGKTVTPYYNKMAIFPVFEAVATGSFAKVFRQMEDNTDAAGNPQPIHMLVMKSAVKFGGQGAVDYSSDASFNVYKLPFNRIRKQFNTDPKERDDMAAGTQMLKVALASLIPAHTYVQNGKAISGQELLDDIMDSIMLLSDLGRKEVEKELFSEDENGELVVDQKKLSKFLTEMLSTRDADKSILDSIQEKDGKLKHPLSAISRIGWIQSILVSFINRRMVDVRTPGEALYQRSVWQMEGLDTIHTDLPTTINNGDPLKTLIEEGAAKGAMECVLSIDFFDHLFKGTSLENASFDDKRAALIEAGVIGKSDQYGANMIGYRIPTQAQSSIHALRCVDVLPVLNHTIILPKDYTRITGSDFDIDKTYVSASPIKLVYSDGKWKQDANAIENSPKAKALKKLLDDYITVLTDANAAHFGLRSIDKDTELLYDVLEDVEGSSKTYQEVHPYDFYCLRSQTQAKSQFLTGKIGIAPFALNNNSQILTMLYGVRFKDDSVMGSLGHPSLAEKTDMDGKNILSWISALINAHVDVAKDPFIIRLGVNKMTFNLTNLLIRTGYGKRTFYFLCQPVMKQMSYETAKADSFFMNDETKSPYQRRSDAKRKAAIEICGRDVVEKWENYFKNSSGSLDNKKLSAVGRFVLENNNDVTKKIAQGLHPATITITTDSPSVGLLDVSYKDYQAIVYMLDKWLESPAQALSNMVQYSKIDTKKQGNSVSKQMAYARGVAETFGDKSLLAKIYGLDDSEFKDASVEDDDSQFEKYGLSRMYEDSFIKRKTHAAITTFLKVMDGQVFEACHGFQFVVSRIAESLNVKGSNAYDKIAKAVEGKIKSEYIINYAESRGIDIPCLVSGPNSIYNRLSALLIQIKTDPKYADMIGQDGNITNMLLNSLIPDYVWNYNHNLHSQYLPDKFSDLKFVRLFDPLDISTQKRDYIIQAWEALLQDDNPNHAEARKFAEDLCVYAFVTSADQTGRTKLFSYVPNYWREGSGSSDLSYVDYIRQQLEIYSDPHLVFDVADKIIDDVALNNWTDFTFVPTIYIYEQDPSSEVSWVSLERKQKRMNVEVGPVFLSTDSKGIEPDRIHKYVKIKRHEKQHVDGSHRSFTVFKLVATVRADSTHEIPIYAKVNPRGYSIENYSYYEYGSSYKPDEEYSVDAEQFVSYYPGNEKGYEDAYQKNLDKLVGYMSSYIISHADQYPDVNLGDIKKKYDSIMLRIKTATYKPGNNVDNVSGEGNFVNHSGGAVGSDSYWGEVGEKYGVKSNHYYHDKKTPNGNVEQSDADYQEGLQKAKLAAIDMKRGWSDLYTNLLARNWNHVKYSDAIFAIGHVVKPGEKNKRGYDVKVILVDGGTGYAVQMAINEGKPVYVFDQQKERWYKCIDGNWSETDTPTLTRNFAGIGTREINDAGKRAIEDVYTKTFRGHQPGESKTTNETEAQPSVQQGPQKNQGFDPESIEQTVMSSLTGNESLQVQQPDENGVIKGKLGVDKSQLIALLGNTMYTANVQSVAEKELVQNAFDATKIAIANGEISKGKLDVSLNSDDRTITISDNGSGMTPEIVQKAFFTIGGSYKGDNIDNKLKSGGLGLAKMAFLFGSDYVELTTVNNGKMTYVKATPELIQNDNFEIRVSNTNKPNGTTVTVRVPESYTDQEGNKRDVYFSTWGDGFFDKPMIGNVEVSRHINGTLKWTKDFNKVPEGFVKIGTATSDFGEIEIFKNFKENTGRFDVLISGLYQFYDYNPIEGDHYATIINILPSVGVKSETYPINNLREGFRSTIDPEVKDLMFFLNNLDYLFAHKKLRISFANSFSMDSERLTEIEKPKEASTKDIIDQLINDVQSQYNPDYKSKETVSGEEFGFRLDMIREERKKAEEKARNSSFDASSIELSEEAETLVDTSKMDLQKAVFYNNTSFVPSKRTVEFLTKYGAKLILIRNSILKMNSDSEYYKDITRRLHNQYWGIALDKTYNGINVSPRLFNFLGLNPIGMAYSILQEEVPEAFDYVLEELLYHNMLHEINHNAVIKHDENFTIQFQYTYAEFSKLGKSLQQWRNEVRELINEYLEDIIKDVERYKHSENVGDSLEGSGQRQKVESGEEIGIEDNGEATNRSENKELLSDVIGATLKKYKAQPRQKLPNGAETLYQFLRTSGLVHYELGRYYMNKGFTYKDRFGNNKYEYEYTDAEGKFKEIISKIKKEHPELQKYVFSFNRYTREFIFNTDGFEFKEISSLNSGLYDYNNAFEDLKESGDEVQKTCKL